MIKMMVTVVMVYTICWLPYNLLLILSESISERLMMFLYFPLHGLAMSHACYNPIIYCFMNTRFRDGLYALLRVLPGFNRCVSRTHSGAGFPHAVRIPERHLSRNVVS
ncbi:unnamed protein product [Acanthoscelides obtectus]|uniref:G-protein coupled receptors family 1 profile domain-containing protein n=1 Tax=Acanthoscelides obtectus TaxID=200917 RepID=A0A9P0LGU7_ACAOB|nr:unnamed protein product [Acanthoscelides obtectus]CAK1655263.1 RYamide receptor [Acanthoscelides obtectus]